MYASLGTIIATIIMTIFILSTIHITKLAVVWPAIGVAASRRVLNRGRVLDRRRVLNRGRGLIRRRSSRRRRWRRRRRGRRRRYPDVKANCFHVKFPKGGTEKRAKRGGRTEIHDRISRSLDVCGP